MEKFKSIVEYTGPIREFSLNGHRYCKISVWGARKWREDLYNIWNLPIKDKTHSLCPPKLNNQALIYAFIIGIVDGDGSIFWTHDSRGEKVLNFTVCGTFKLIKWIKKQLLKIIDAKLTIRQNGNCKFNFRINTSYHKAEIIINYLKTINLSFRLSRKWDKINEIK